MDWAYGPMTQSEDTNRSEDDQLRFRKLLDGKWVLIFGIPTGE